MITIRAAAPRDESAWRAMWDEFIRGGPEPCAAEAPDHVWSSVMSPDSAMAMIVAEDESGGLAGFALYLPHPYSWSARPVCYLLDLFVAARARRQGIGKTLMKRLGDIAHDAGWLKVYWMTQADNDASRRLYDEVASLSPLVRYDMYVNEH
jgi:GNAT superfamily N-acetyltransferase